MSTARGRVGEDAAVAHLRRRGYRILERNYRCPVGELDCVAVHGDALVFLEIKARSSNRFGAPLEAVDRTKQRRLTRVARYYAAVKGLEAVPQRFDVVAVWLEARGPRVEVMENAFDALE